MAGVVGGDVGCPAGSGVAVGGGLELLRPAGGGEQPVQAVALGGVIGSGDGGGGRSGLATLATVAPVTPAPSGPLTCPMSSPPVTGPQVRLPRKTLSISHHRDQEPV